MNVLYFIVNFFEDALLSVITVKHLAQLEKCFSSSHKTLVWSPNTLQSQVSFCMPIIPTIRKVEAGESKVQYYPEWHKEASAINLPALLELLSLKKKWGVSKKRHATTIEEIEGYRDKRGNLVRNSYWNWFFFFIFRVVRRSYGLLWWFEWSPYAYIFAFLVSRWKSYLGRMTRYSLVGGRHATLGLRI